MAAITGVLFGGHGTVAGTGITTGFRAWTIDITTESLSVNSLEDTDDANGRLWESMESGLNDWSGSADTYELGSYNPLTLIGGSGSFVFSEHENDAGTNNNVYTAVGIISDISTSVNVDGLVVTTLSFTGNGAVTISTA